MVDRDFAIKDLTVVDFDKIRDLMPPTIPPALLKELLRSCNGE